MSENIQQRLRQFQVGDTVKWTGQAAGGRKDHEGVIEGFNGPGGSSVGWKTATVKCEKRHKKTDKLLGHETFRPYLSQLTLVYPSENAAS